jgi:acyl-CoA thioesterase I
MSMNGRLTKIGGGQAGWIGCLAAFVCAVYVGGCAKGSDGRSAAQSSGVLAAAARTDSQSNGAGVAAAAAPGAPAAARAGQAARGVVLFAGTSLTAGLGLDPDSAYPMLIQRKIDSAGLPFDVVNAGVSGETSSGLLDRLDWLLRARFDVFVLETGANDGLRGLPTTTLQSNLERAIDRIRAKRPDARIVLIQMEALPNLGPKYEAAFHAVYPRVAREKSVTLLPFLLNDVAGRRGLNQADGVHPNDVGEHIVADNVWRGLRPVLDGIANTRH